MYTLLAAAEAGTEAVSVSSSDLNTLIDNVVLAVQGIYELANTGFDFISGNALCLLMVGLSFAGAGLGLVGRAFKTSRR